MLNKLRIINKLTQQQLAKMLDVKQSYISQLEHFSKKPSFNFLEKVSNKFNICIIILISEYYCANCELQCITKDKVGHHSPILGTVRCNKNYNNYGDIMVISKKNTRIKITISKELYNDLKFEAEYEGRSISNMAAKIISDYYRDKQK